MGTGGGKSWGNEPHTDEKMNKMFDSEVGPSHPGIQPTGSKTVFLNCSWEPEVGDMKILFLISGWVESAGGEPVETNTNYIYCKKFHV